MAVRTMRLQHHCVSLQALLAMLQKEEMDEAQRAYYTLPVDDAGDYCTLKV